MGPEYKRGLFIFRQDLRVHDNTGLYYATKECKEVVPLFVFDQEILHHLPANDKRVGFLVEVLQQLHTQLTSYGSGLQVEYGNVLPVIEKLVSAYDIQSLYRNKSYGPNHITRDKHLKERAAQHDVVRNEYEDYLLVEPEKVKQMKVFTPFYKRRMGKPKRITMHHIDTIQSPPLPHTERTTIKAKVPYAPQNVWTPSGRQKRLEEFDFLSYNDTRNYPSQDGSSKLAPYIRFGLVSIRQVFKEQIERLGIHSGPEQTGITHHTKDGIEYVTLDKKLFTDTFISELAWREFWQHIAHFFPETRHVAFMEKYRDLERANREVWFDAWRNGQTGYPIVDAGMRQLKAENRMHNRVRMIVASFLTKDLLIDRRWGQQHFADYLLDHDVNVNQGNRQRAASVGADPKPLRIFNPILQSERYDKDALYIKKWIPELKDAPLHAIHNPLKHTLSYTVPIVDHYITSKIAKKMYYKEAYSL